MTSGYDLFKDSKGLSEFELGLAKITSSELLEIFNDYSSLYKELENEAAHFSKILIGNEQINSVKFRVKNPAHLLVKIVRKRKEALQKGDTSSAYLKINVSNYKQIITDLIGIRGIYLFKAYWKKIDEDICDNFIIFDQHDVCIFHGPEDDLDFYHPNEFVKSINTKKIRYIRVERPTKYRSTHYILQTNLPEIKFELQIRSILGGVSKSMLKKSRLNFDKIEKCK